MSESGRGENKEASTFKMPSRMSKPELSRRADTRGGIPRRISAEESSVKPPDAVFPASAPDTRTTPEAKPAAIETAARIETPKPSEQPSTPVETPEAKLIETVDLDQAPDGKAVPLKELTEPSSDSLLLKGAKGSGFALAFLGYNTGRAAVYVAGRMVLPGVDWLARKMDSLGDRLLSKHFPLAKKMGAYLDRIGKWLGLDKTLFEIISKKQEERKKLAEKVLTELRADEKKYQTKADADAKRKKRETKLTKAFGSETARVLIDEIDVLDKSE